MNKYFFYLLVFPILLCVFCKSICSGQETPFCWKVLSKESKTPSYIFGTIHHLGYKPIFNNKQLLSLILESKFIVLEIDTIEVKKKYFPTKTSSTGIDNLISAADYHTVSIAYLKYTGKDLKADKYQKPTAISSAIRNGKESLEPHITQMEAAFYTICKDKNIPIKGLETHAFRDSIFSSFSPEEEAKMMMHEINQLLGGKIADEYKACFEKNDLNCVCAINDMAHYAQAGDSTIVLKRNLFWINSIQNYIHEGNAFIAVGAAHLCGDYGILALLRKAGYTILPIPLAGNRISR